MSRWTHPQCEACWIDRQGHWEPAGELDGEPVSILRSVRRPALIQYPADETPPVEQCCFCGSPTIIGIYVRYDPASHDLKACRGHDD